MAKLTKTTQLTGRVEGEPVVKPGLAEVAVNEERLKSQARIFPTH